jgi:hypothetical protein
MVLALAYSQGELQCSLMFHSINTDNILPSICAIAAVVCVRPTALSDGSLLTLRFKYFTLKDTFIFMA